MLSLGVDLLQGFFLAMPQVEPGGASEESLAVIAEMQSKSDESQIFDIWRRTSDKYRKGSTESMLS